MYDTNNTTNGYSNYDICAVDGCDINVSKSLIKNGFKVNKNGNTVTPPGLAVAYCFKYWHL